MRLLRHFFRFLRYYFKAGTRYDVHSPFVFDFTEAVLEDDRWYYAFEEWEVLRRRLISSKVTIPVTDYGAGSQMQASRERSLSSLARYSANRPYACRLLFRIVQFAQPSTMLELGTSLGISTGYQAAAALHAKMITIEGCPNVARYAAQHFQLMKLKNVRLLHGQFDEMLPIALQELGKLDYLFLDGNHRREPTLRYFYQCLAHAGENSIFVLDDIHWSDEMEQAWGEIRQHPAVSLSVDLFFFGVVFFRKENRTKEHFILAPWLWKPWSIGLGDFFK